MHSLQILQPDLHHQCPAPPQAQTAKRPSLGLACGLLNVHTVHQCMRAPEVQDFLRADKGW